MKNISATADAYMKTRGKTIRLVDPVVVPKAQAAKAVKGRWRPLVARLPFEQAVLLRRA